MNYRVPNSAANSSGPSVGASSLVTDANSALTGGPQLQRSTSINTESYMRLPASPMSFSSNNISGSSVMDGASIIQQYSHQEPMQKQGVSCVTSHPMAADHLDNLLSAQKKLRIDMRQDDFLQQQALQQFLQRQDSLPLQSHSSQQLQAIIHQQRLLQRQQQQQQILQSLPQMQMAQMHQPQQLMRNNLESHAILSAVHDKRPIDSGVCARRLMQYIYQQRHRPQDNSILYWRKFVAEYFAPQARKRWCFSMYDNVGNHALGAFSQASMDAWHCGICGSRSGKGFDATFEVLPRLNQIKFDRGIIDEILFLGMPHECRLPTGAMLLEYGKAVQETVYEQVRVVRQGQLRIIFSLELKILSWEFCADHHEVFFSRRLITSQINQLLQVAQKLQTSIPESGSPRVASPDLQANCNLFVTAGRQLARSLELQSLNDLGFSKRYIRCLQIAEVVNSMKDLIDFSRENNEGPIESLKNYSQQAAAKLQTQKMQEMEQLMTAQCLPADQSVALNKFVGNHPGLANHLSNNQLGNRVLNNNAWTPAALNNYQNLPRSSLNSDQKLYQGDAACSLSSNQVQQGQFPHSMASVLTNPSGNSVSGAHQQQQLLSVSLPQETNMQPPPANQQLQQHAIQQMLQDLINNNRVSRQSFSSPNRTGNAAAEARTNPASLPNHALGLVPSWSNSFKMVANNHMVSSDNFNSRQDLPPDLHLPELDHDISKEFMEKGIVNGEQTDNGFG